AEGDAADRQQRAPGALVQEPAQAEQEQELVHPLELSLWIEKTSPRSHGSGMAWKGFAIIAAIGCALGGCSLATQPLAVALAGAGTSTAIQNSMNGTAYRTFSHPLAEVKAATLDTLSTMGIRVDSFETVENGELVVGSAI